MTATVLVDTAGVLLVFLLAVVTVRLVLAESATGPRRGWDVLAGVVSVSLFAVLVARILTAVLP